MKYQITKDGCIASTGLKHVVLHEHDGVELGIWVQPGAVPTAFRLRDRFTAMYDEALAARAEDLGKTPSELTDEDSKGLAIKMDDQFIAALSAQVRTCFVRWDEGLVTNNENEPVDPFETEPKSGQLYVDLWIGYLCAHDVQTAMDVLGVASGRARELEGNSEGLSAGTGATDEAPGVAEAPESTASAGRSADVPTAHSSSADISEVPASPA